METIIKKSCANKNHSGDPLLDATLENFNRDSKSADGFGSWCRACQQARYTKKEKTSIDINDLMENSQGGFDPVELVKEIDKTRNELVCRLIPDAKAVQSEMQSFKKIAMAEIGAFIDLAAMEWDVTLGGEKGNTTLHSYDGKYKIQIQVSEHLVFDEQLQVAKKMIDQCLTEWTRDSGAEIKALINTAFQVDKQGKLNTNRILSLRRLDIKDKLWLKAMDAITASLQVIGSKEYIRFYERDSSKGQWCPIALDMAAI